MQRVQRFSCSSSPHHRQGASTLDYVLVLGATLPIVAFVLSKGVRMIQLVYEMICVLLAWPFM